MRLLLGSGGFRTPQRREFLNRQMRSFFGPIDKILFVPYAVGDHNSYLERLTDGRLNGGYALDGIHRCEDPVKAVEQAQAIYVGGGNTFRLLNELYRHGLIGPIARRVREGLPYLGISAGANVACPTIKTTNDMPIILPPSLDSLSLVPFQINAHYFSGPTFVEIDGVKYRHFGETRDERISEFHELNETPVIGLREGAILRVTGSQAQLLGKPARLLVKGLPAREVPPGEAIWPLTDG